jgi:hypothetical protein
LQILVNYRGRLPGVGRFDAGNYISTLNFDKDVYASPHGIRDAIEVVSRSVRGEQASMTVTEACRRKAYPNMLNVWGSRRLVVTSWSSFDSSFLIPGCVPVLHITVQDPDKYLKTIAYDKVVVFRARREQLAVMVISRHLTAEMCMKAIPYLKAVPLV